MILAEGGWSRAWRRVCKQQRSMCVKQQCCNASRRRVLSVCQSEVSFSSLDQDELLHNVQLVQIEDSLFPSKRVFNRVDIPRNKDLNLSDCLYSAINSPHQTCVMAVLGKEGHYSSQYLEATQAEVYQPLHSHSGDAQLCSVQFYEEQI